MEAEALPHVKDAWPDGWQMFSGVMSLAAFFRMSVLAPEQTRKERPSALPLLEEQEGASTEEIELQVQTLSIEISNINSIEAQISGDATKEIYNLVLKVSTLVQNLLDALH